MALRAGCGALSTIGGTADQQLAACCSTRNMWRCDRVSGGAAVLMMQAADVRQGAAVEQSEQGTQNEEGDSSHAGTVRQLLQKSQRNQYVRCFW